MSNPPRVQFFAGQVVLLLALGCAGILFLVWLARAPGQALAQGPDTGAQSAEEEKVDADESASVVQPDIPFTATPANKPSVGPLVFTAVRTGSLSRVCTPLEVTRLSTRVVPSAPAGQTMPAPSISFDGLLAVNSNPRPKKAAADVSAAVGLTQVVETTNFALGIFNRDGSLRCAPLSNGEPFRGMGGPCDPAQGAWGDAIVEYDHAADRWLISRFARLPNPANRQWFQCVAVSTSGDPAAGYARYQFPVSNNRIPYFNDYPKFGVWTDGYYWTADANGIFSRTGVMVGVFERSKLLAGDPTARFVEFFIPANGGKFQMLPANLAGPIPPPNGTPDYILQTRDTQLGFPADRIAMWALRVNWTNPLSSTLRVNLFLKPAPFNANTCGGHQLCIPQKGVTQTLDTLSYGYLMSPAVYRNFGDHETLLLNQTVAGGAANNATGIRWYELRRAPGNSWSLYQQGTYAPDRRYRWLGTMAMDKQGNLALGFSESGPALFPSPTFVGRLVTDPLNTLPQSETSLIRGSGSQIGSGFFGDYATMNIDPVDDCTFWYASEYYTTTSTPANFATRIGAFKFPGCS